MEERKGNIEKGLDWVKDKAEKAGDAIENTFDNLTGKGPAERTGERIDRGAETAYDRLTGRGPGEKFGERFDRATNDLTTPGNRPMGDRVQRAYDDLTGKGTAERIGESIDRGVDSLDGHDERDGRQGLGERIGEGLDRTVGNTRDGLTGRDGVVGRDDVNRVQGDVLDRPANDLTDPLNNTNDTRIERGYNDLNRQGVAERIGESIDRGVDSLDGHDERDGREGLGERMGRRLDEGADDIKRPR